MKFAPLQLLVFQRRFAPRIYLSGLLIKSFLLAVIQLRIIEFRLLTKCRQSLQFQVRIPSLFRFRPIQLYSHVLVAMLSPLSLKGFSGLLFYFLLSSIANLSYKSASPIVFRFTSSPLLDICFFLSFELTARKSSSLSSGKRLRQESSSLCFFRSSSKQLEGQKMIQRCIKD